MGGARTYNLDLIGEIDSFDDDNIDAYITLENGDKYFGTFFTTRNIETIMRRHSESGESKGGIYFWATDMIIVKELTMECMNACIDDLLESRDFYSVFCKINEVNH